MGLLNFIKDVGEKLFGASEAKAATADELKKELDKASNSRNADWPADALGRTGDRSPAVAGEAPKLEAAEKITLALGNTVGN